MPEDHVFFDLREFFGNEAKYLEKHMSNPQKTVRLNGQESVLASPDLDYTEELAPFINSDINKPSWKDKYQVDSIFSGTRLTGVRYVAVDDALKTRELQLSLSDGEVERVWIRNSIHSIISRSDQELRYNRQEGYAIEGRQSGRFFGEKHFSVEVEF